ncbi:MAG: right-handed parallel beta-helix repeat-containing protein [Elusimicrobia bacterium]|nr:right-handed parallel beta-helix repeat-containing protein [Elusimicrobiota bacterium]
MAPGSGPAEWVLRVSGDSMRFLLKPGDVILAQRAPLPELESGEAVVLIGWKGAVPSYVVHRLLGKWRSGGRLVGLTKGDANILPDRPLPEGSFAGRVLAVRRRGRWLRLHEARGARALLPRLAGACLFQAWLAWEAGRRGLLRSLTGPAEGLGQGAGAALGWAARAAASAIDALQERTERAHADRASTQASAETAPGGVFGVLDRDTVWSGEVRLSGDIHVPEGATLTILPGTRVQAEPSSSWTFWNARCIHPPARPSILVAGRLQAEGRPDAAIELGCGLPWGGLHFVAGAGPSTLAHVEVSGSETGGVNVWGAAGVLLKRSAFKDNDDGINVRRGGSVILETCVISASRGHGLTASGLSSAALDSCVIEDCRVGVALWSGRLQARSTSLRRIASTGVTLEGGAAYLERCSLSECTQSAVSAAAGANLELERCILSASRVGVQLKDARLAVRSSSVTGHSEAGLDLEGSLPLSISDSTVVDCPTAIRFSGKALDLKDLRISGCGEGLMPRSGRVFWRHGSLEGGRLGIDVPGSAEVALDGVALSSCQGNGSHVRGGSLAAKDCSWSGHSQACVCVDGGSLVLERCALSASRVGIGLKDARLSVHSTSCSGFSEAGLDLEGSLPLSISDSTVADSPTAIRFSGKALDLKDLRISGCGEGLMPRSGRVFWRRGSLEGGRLGIDVPGSAEVALDGVALSSCQGNGSHVRGGSLAAKDCSWSGHSQACVCMDGGSLMLERCVFDGGRWGLSAARGSSRGRDLTFTRAAETGVRLDDGVHDLAGLSISGCPTGLSADRGTSTLRSVRVRGASIVGVRLAGDRHDVRGLRTAGCPVPAQGGRLSSSGWKARLRSLVLRTNPVPGLAGLYRLSYHAASRLCGRWLGSDPGVIGVYAHRSFADNDWVPGLSDIDLVVAAGPAESSDPAWLDRFWRRYDRLRAVFPFMGECLLMGPRELSAFIRWGGLRGRALASSGIRLSGSPLRAETAAGPADGEDLSVFGECCHAWTRALQDGVWNGALDDTALRLKAGRALLDLGRHAAAPCGDAGFPASRRSFVEDPPRSRLGERAADLRLLMDPASGEADWKRRARQLAAAGLADLHRGASRILASLESRSWHEVRRLTRVLPSPGAADSSVSAGFERMTEAVRAGLGEAVVAMDGDDLYRTYIILDDSSMEERKVLRVLDAAAELSLDYRTRWPLPIILSESLWLLWSRLSYLECPTRFLDGAGPSLYSAGQGPRPESWHHSWGGARLRPGPWEDGVISSSAKESLANLHASWRLLCSGGSRVSPEYTLHYLRSRAMGLRLLLERDIAASFFQLDRLEAIHEREFPGSGAARGSEPLAAATSLIGSTLSLL